MSKVVPSVAIALAALALVVGCAGEEEAGNGDASVANLLRLYQSTLLYATDTDDTLPQSNWMDAIAPYGELSEHPEWFRRPGAEDGEYGYAFNQDVLGFIVNRIESPNDTALIFESTVTGRNAVGGYPAIGLERDGVIHTVFLSARTLPAVAIPESRKQTVCLTALRQIGSGLAIYASDNDDRFPESAWTDTVYPYLGPSREIIQCPSVAAGSFGYAFNQSLLGASTTGVVSPASVPLAFDSSVLTRNAATAFVLPDPPRHGGNNAVYADGHGATLP